MRSSNVARSFKEERPERVGDTQMSDTNNSLVHSSHSFSSPFSIQVSKDAQALRAKHLVQSSWIASSQTCGAFGSSCAIKC